MDAELGGDPPCWAHLLDEDGRVEAAGPRRSIRVRRIYEPPRPDDGFRVLVDRLWPRGVRKEAGVVHAWLRDLAPSDALRRWYGHEPARWPAFQRRYRWELAGARQQAALSDLVQRARSGPVTLLCAARDPSRSNAEVVRQVLLASLAEPEGETAAAGARRPRP